MSVCGLQWVPCLVVQAFASCEVLLYNWWEMAGSGGRWLFDLRSSYGKRGLYRIAHCYATALSDAWAKIMAAR